MAFPMSRLIAKTFYNIRAVLATPSHSHVGALGSVLFPRVEVVGSCQPLKANIHTTTYQPASRQLRGLANVMPNEPTEWPKYNDVVYPPRQLGERQRPAEVTHFIPNVKYSTKKLWYLASLIRGLSIDEAIKQMSFQEKKGSTFIKQALLEAQEMAVKDHNVEYKSNLFVADSRAMKGHTIRGYRKHMATRMGVISYRYSHYLLRLREGKPPKHYYAKEKSGHEKMEDYVEDLRSRTIKNSL